MDFASFGFIFRFLPIFMLLYFMVPEKMKNLILFLGSLVFYAWGDKNRLITLMLVIIFDYVSALLMGLCKKGWKRIIFFVPGVVLNLSLILLSHQSGLEVPVGALIYCMQSVSYLSEVYRGTVLPQKNLIKLGVYISMFTQMNLGPIVCYRDIEKQLSWRSVEVENVKRGLIRFIIGLGKKVLLSDNICVFWNTVSAANPEDLSTITAWLGFASFAFRILFDYSGYADMAIGLAQIMGFSLKENFNYPFNAISVKDFWKRWNISLGVWLKDYVYIPLGGSKKGILRKWFHMLLIGLLIGAWHGVAYHFFAWGLWFVFWMLSENILLERLFKKLPKIIARVYTWLVFVVSLPFFAADSMGQSLDYIKVLFGMKGVGLVDRVALFSLKSQMVLIIVAIFASMPWAHHVSHRLRASESGLGMAVVRISEKLFPALLLILTLAYMAKGY